MVTEQPRTISDKLFTIEVYKERKYDEINGAHYVPSRDKWIPSSTSIDLARAKSLKKLLEKYIEEKEQEKWLEELR